MKRSQHVILILLFGALVMTALVVAKHYCPPSGIAFSKERRDFHRLKNRTTLPQETDFDGRVTLSSMLRPGDDRARWSTSRAARVEGYVVSLAKGPVELANCYLPCSRDVHIHVGLRPDAPPREQVVVEVTPRVEDWAKRQGSTEGGARHAVPGQFSNDWSEENLRRALLGHWCRFEGWLFFDSHHAGESENVAPGTTANWRATAWELHPVTKIEVLK